MFFSVRTALAQFGPHSPDTFHAHIKKGTPGIACAVRVKDARNPDINALCTYISDDGYAKSHVRSGDAFFQKSGTPATCFIILHG